MNIYGNEYYDLLTRALGSGDVNAKLRGFLQETVAQKYNNLNISGFEFAEDMQLDFTYQQLQEKYGIYTMANYYDIDSPAIPKMEGGEILSVGTVPRMKDVKYLNEDKMRKLIIKEQRGIGVRESALGSLFSICDGLVGGHINSLSYQRMQMISKGYLALNENNNPFGIKGVTFGAHVPTENYKTLTGTKRWWTDDARTTEGSACDPIQDLKDMVKVARTKGIRGHFEVSDNYMDAILAHSKVKAALAGKFWAGTAISGSLAYLASVSRDMQIQALGEIVGAPFAVQDHISQVEKLQNGKLVENTFDSFEFGVIAFVPDGKIGEIVVVEPLEVGNGTYGYLFGGRLQLTVGSDPVKKCQSFNSEMTALCLPTKAKYMWYLTPSGAN